MSVWWEAYMAALSGAGVALGNEGAAYMSDELDVDRAQRAVARIDQACALIADRAQARWIDHHPLTDSDAEEGDS
jgi:hypothetical protein